MSAHQGLPEFAVVGDVEVEEFVDDHVVAEFAAQVQEFGIEGQVAGGGAGGPFGFHGADGDGTDFDVEFLRPFEHPGLEFFFAAPFSHLGTPSPF